MHAQKAVSHIRQVILFSLIGLGLCLSPILRAQVLVDEGTPGYYNDSLGAILDGTAPQFPLPGEDPTIYPAEEPNLGAAADLLGCWLGTIPEFNDNWIFRSTIPSTWALNTEAAIVYVVDGGSGRGRTLEGDFDADNGLFVWVNGEYKFGAVQPGMPSPIGQFEYTNVDLGPLQAGTNYIQILLGNNGIETGYRVRIWANNSVAPIITHHPTNLVVLAGDVANFSVTASGTEPLAYQWLFNDEVLVGATNSALVLSNAQPSRAGNYSVAVSNVAGDALSSNAVLTVNGFAPTIQGQPQGQSLYVGKTAQFSVSVSGSAPLSFQWEKDERAIIGATNILFTLARVRLEDAGSYRVIVTNAFGVTNSVVATLAVRPAPACVSPPDGMVAWWPGESNLWDMANGVDGLDLSIYGGNLSYAPGMVGTAFQFMLGGSLVAPEAAALNLGTGDGFTFECWINPDYVAGYSGIFGWGGSIPGVPSSPTGVNLRIPSPGLLEAQLIRTNGQATFLRTQAPVLLARQWQHVALSYDKSSGLAQICLNGVAVAQTNIGSVNLETAGRFRIGSGGGLNYYGLIDEPTLYNRALAQTDLAAIFNADLSGKCPLPPLPCLELTGIAAFWQGESNTVDIVGGNDGRKMPTNYPSALAYQSGVKGTAFDFNNVNFISVPRSDGLDVGKAEGLTIEGWVYGQSTVGPIVEWTDTNSFGVYLAMGYSQPYALEANLIDTLGGFHFIRSTAPVAYSGWQHFGLTYDKASGVASLYSAGGLVATTNMGSFTPKTDTEMLIGYHPRYTGTPVYGGPPPYDRLLQGGIDELAVYRRALGAEEIRRLARLRQGRCSEYPPQIGRQPQEAIVVEGGVASFAVTAGGSQPLYFQWQRGGTPLAGAVDEVLALTDVALTGAGDYSVIVTNAYGAATSHVARLEVLPAGQSLPVPSGAVAWWRAEGNGWDEIGRSDAVWGISEVLAEYMSGMAGSAFHLNGSSTFLQVAANSNLNVGMGPGFSVEGWINPESANPASVVDWNDTRGNVGVGIMINRTGPGVIEATLTDTNGINSTERMVTFASALYTVWSPTNSLPGWTHVALTFDKASGRATLLVNGQVVASRNLPAIRTYSSPQVPVPFSPTTSGNLYFGYRPSGYNGGLRFRGGMDEFAVYDRSLSLTEVRAIYLVGSNGKCPPPPLPCLAPAPGIAGWWRGESNALDSVAGNHGSVMPTNFPVTQAYQIGRLNGGFAFRGPNHIAVPRADVLDVGSEEGFTVEAWIQPNQSGPAPIVEWTDTNNFGASLWLSYTRGPTVLEASLMDASGGLHIIQSPAGTVSNAVWQHVAVTYDKVSGLAMLYVNGTTVATTNFGSFTARTDLPLLIGYHPPNLAYSGAFGSPPPVSLYFRGAMDEISIYRRALGPEEIHGIVDSRPGKCRELPPEVGRQPQDAFVIEGGVASFAVSAGGSEPLHFQWHHNGMPIAGAVDGVLALTDVALNAAGEYSVIVVNAFGAATSHVARLDVLPAGQCLPVPVGAVAWWKGEGNGWDELGRSDAVWPVNMTPAYTTGMVGRSFSFNGSSTYLQVAANSNLDVGMGPGFTVEGWIKPESLGGGSLVDWNDTRGNVGVGIMINRTGPGVIEATLTDTNGINSNERMVTFASALYTVWSPTNSLPGWTHVALTFDKASGRATLLVNGQVVASRNLPAIRTYNSPQIPVPFSPTTSGNLYFGFRLSGYYAGWPFRGGMDEFAVYARSLSVNGIRSIYLTASNGKCAPPPTCNAPAPGIAAWWRGESNALDSVAGNHGQVMPVGFPTNLAYGVGFLGSAFNLNGQNHFQVPASAALDLGLSEGITVEAWVNPTQVRPMPILEWNSGTGQQGVNLSYSFSRGPGIVEFNVVDTAGVSHQVFTPLNTAGFNQWVHVAATYDKASGRATVYCNGVAVTNRVVGIFTPRTGLDLLLGYRPPGAYVGGGNRFIGGIDEVAIYCRALTGDEIWSAYHSTLGKCTAPPLIVEQPGNIRVNAGDTAILSVEVLGTPVLHYQWFLSDGTPVPDDSEQPDSFTNSLHPSLVFADLSASREGTYYCVVTNTFGVAFSSNATLLVNYPPVADAGATVRSLVSPNGTNATVVLDGSLSGDPDGDDLTHEWFVRGEVSPFASGVVAVTSLPLGTNLLTLRVSDGMATAGQDFAVEVITTSEAVDLLARVVQSGAGSPQPLVSSLRAALASIDRSQPEVAINQLEAFKHKVLAQVMPVDAELAAQLIAAAQAIIDALNADSGEAAQSVRITSITRGTGGHSHLQIQGRAGRTLIVETSTDGVTWWKVGVAKDQGADQYEFDDTGESWEMMRFYRVVSPE